MLRVIEESINQIEIERSRFITYVNRVFSENEAKDYITAIKKLHPDATHHCYCFVIGANNEIQRSNDDREPSGTAGIPMLEALKLSNIHDCICITVRYFGGIKLGAGGLVRAYSSSVSNALKLAKKAELKTVYEYKMKFGYNYIGKIDYLLNNEKCIIKEQIYEEDVVYTFLALNHDFLKQIQEISSDTIKPVFVSEQIIEIPTNL